MNDALKNNNRVAFLDYLRIFAFVSVLIGHKFYGYVLGLSNDASVHATPRLMASWLLPFFYGGGAGVVVFFMVSGYIITHVLQTEQTIEFLIKRIFRIYPLYIVAVSAQYIALTITGHAPGLSILFSQLLLVGDIMGTPYSLNGVEWTLRVEVVFYIFMAILSSLGLIVNNKRSLPYALLITTLICGFIAPIPSIDIWSKGYLTIYGPFLLLGSMFYLFEKHKVGISFLMFSILVVFYNYYKLIAIFQKGWLNDHFAILAFFVFLLSWAFRKHLKVTPLILLLSEMTYAVYLFHNWFFDYVKKSLDYFNVSFINSEILSLIALLLACYFMVRFVEKPGIKLGRTVLNG